MFNVNILRVYELLRHFLSALESSARPRPLVSVSTGLLGLSLAQTRDQRLEDTEMESLPEPSDLVEDEWAAMKIRFKKEGLNWDKLGPEERILQVIMMSLIFKVTAPAVNCYVHSMVGWHGSLGKLPA